MKKAIIGLALTVILTGISASADELNKGAFIGEWTSQKNTETDNAVLYINYCDNDTIQVNFSQITNGSELFDFTEYNGTVTNNTAHILFDYTDEYGTTKPGFMDIGLFTDNIWVSVYSDSGVTFFNNMMKKSDAHFNPFASPYSYNVKINLNGKEQSLNNKPFILNGTTYVPLRGVLDAMNLNVYWDDFKSQNSRTQMITTARNNTILQFKRTDISKGFSPWELIKWENEYPNTADEPTDKLDISFHQPIIIDGTSYVPLRIVSEGYGAQVEWSGDTHTVSITGSIASDTKKLDSELEKIQSFNVHEADKTAAKYAGMNIYDITPYYTYKSKYYFYTQADKQYKITHKNEIIE